MALGMSGHAQACDAVVSQEARLHDRGAFREGTGRLFHVARDQQDLLHAGAARQLFEYLLEFLVAGEFAHRHMRDGVEAMSAHLCRGRNGRFPLLARQMADVESRARLQDRLALGQLRRIVHGHLDRRALREPDDGRALIAGSRGGFLETLGGLGGHRWLKPEFSAGESLPGLSRADSTRSEIGSVYQRWLRAAGFETIRSRSTARNDNWQPGSSTVRRSPPNYAPRLGNVPLSSARLMAL